MPLILLWIVLPIIVIWGIYKIIRLFVLTGESVYEAKKENKEFASYLGKVCTSRQIDGLAGCVSAIV